VSGPKPQPGLLLVVDELVEPVRPHLLAQAREELADGLTVERAAVVLLGELRAGREHVPALFLAPLLEQRETGGGSKGFSGPTNGWLRTRIVSRSFSSIHGVGSYAAGSGSPMRSTPRRRTRRLGEPVLRVDLAGADGPHGAAACRKWSSMAREGTRGSA